MDGNVAVRMVRRRDACELHTAAQHGCANAAHVCSHKQAVTSLGYGAPDAQSADDIVRAAQDACSRFVNAACAALSEGAGLDHSVVHELQDLASTSLEEPFMVRSPSQHNHLQTVPPSCCFSHVQCGCRCHCLVTKAYVVPL